MPSESIEWVQGRIFVGTNATGYSVIFSGSKNQGGVKKMLVALAYVLAWMFDNRF